ncbi:Mini-ribonuclease 3 [Anaerotruncus sp. DFI.9.16]|uniref:Mini-ribonuclease 3 n=1 Tax=Anaerotruncus sp. DFI.9.16 TaxID=2965275 RepID=UPI00210EF5F5|nr:ribonuclease III domain-containing protein [Anaerotruncus sp. DFI.9.16]MCQ4894398.1 ribonuclease III [Anaerotruncus sp. DFI.9.16]
MLDLKLQEQNPKLLSPLTLAFLGDAVYELCVRQRVVAEGNCPVNDMHRKAVKLVNAAAQSDAFERISGALTEEELAVYKRGRNANATSSPKHAALADYRRATGVEALFGYLYLKGETERIGELFDLACAAAEG